MGDKVDLKLIPEFDGTSVLEWVEKVELICHLCGVKYIEKLLLLRLTGGAFAVHQQLSDKEKEYPARIKAVLYNAFAIDPCTAYEQFAARS